ncbi:MAG: TetR/AcrR family transcriptional regulator [Calditrichota bacterium]
MAKLDQRDWLNLGLKILAKEGPEKLTIQDLCSTLGVTKGSFYHHFRNREAFVTALLTYWEETLTEEIISASESKETLLDRINELTNLTTSRIAIKMEVAIRAWALTNPQVRIYQKRVDERRLAYLNQLTSQLPGNVAEAELLAKMLFAIYVGAQQMIPPIQSEELRGIYDYIKQLTVINKL